MTEAVMTDIKDIDPRRVIWVRSHDSGDDDKCVVWSLDGKYDVAMGKDAAADIIRAKLKPLVMP